jgi:hypothetical protein
MTHLSFRQQGRELLEDGLDGVRLECGHRFPPCIPLLSMLVAEENRPEMAPAPVAKRIAAHVR